jgi:solute carrier family 12 sodium/potassium/chloride transporter 2
MIAPASPVAPARRYGTFTGVFMPTLLTMLGVILYVRLGWVVGNAGFGGALLIILLGATITTATGLSLSSIATNTRIGRGGPFAILSRSLGREVGGAISVPLYLTRPIGVAMQVMGLREGVLWVFPALPALGIDLSLLGVMVLAAMLGVELVLRVQVVVLALLSASLASIVASPLTWQAGEELVLWGAFPGSVEAGLGGTTFWAVFAVYFPATTGILAGANMAGDLEDPRRSIPRGTLSAIAVAVTVYMLVAWWCAHTGSPDALVRNYNHLIDHALFSPVVLAGLFGATATAALGGVVGGGRILSAIAEQGVLPGTLLAQRTASGEPRNATLLTGLLALVFLMVRDLNAVAPLVTVFFLITYSMINLVVLLEGGLGLVSFRPTLQVPLIVPAIGLAGCLVVLAVMNPVFSLVAGCLIVGLYVWLERRGVGEGDEDVRSSVMVAVAEWAASRVTEQDLNNVRAWRPNLLVPVRDPARIRREYDLLLHLTLPEGSIKLLGLTQDDPGVLAGVQALSDEFLEDHLRSSWSHIPFPDFVSAVGAGMMALRSAFWRPNLLVLDVPEDAETMSDLRRLINVAHDHEVGVMVIAMHPVRGVGRQEEVHVWVQAHPETWDPHAAFESGNLNLILLMGYRLMRSWGARLRVLTAVREPEQIEQARAFLLELCDLARFPARVEVEVYVGPFQDCLADGPTCDVTILGLPPEPERERLVQLVEDARSSCVFVRDSGRESARA